MTLHDANVLTAEVPEETATVCDRKDVQCSWLCRNYILYLPFFVLLVLHLFFLFLLRFCRRHLFCCFTLTNLCLKFENKKRDRESKCRNPESTRTFLFFCVICRCMCHVGICFIIECSIISLIIYIIFHVV